MTCVIGLADGGRVYMAADSALSDGWEVRAMAGGKLHRFGDILYGVTGTTRIAQLIQYHTKPEAHCPGMSDEEYLVTAFVGGVRRVLKEYGYAKIEDNEEDMTGGLLIAYHGRLYVLGTSYQLCETRDGLDAIGCGREYALGAMLALADKPPHERLLRSLECVAAVCKDVCAPFVVEEL